MEKFTLFLKSNRNEIPKFDELLHRVNESFGMPPEKFVNLQIATSEALINAIVHGNKENESKVVFTEIIIKGNTILIRIKDEGDGFDIDKLPDPTSHENILKESGRGIYIMKSLVDDFRCNSSREGTEYCLMVSK